MVSIGVVILNYNSYQDSINLVAALQNQTVAKALQIVIVDNASPNNSYKYLKPLEEEYNNVKVLQTGENLGYAKGNNFGLNYLDTNVHPKFVAILNNDIELNNDCFEKLVVKYGMLERPFVIAPKQLDSNSIEVQPYPLNTFWDDLLSLFFVFRYFHKRNALQLIDNTGHNTMRVTIVPGSFMFVSLNLFKKTGFFYQNTFLYAEERFIAVKAKEIKCYNYVLLDESYIHSNSKTIDTEFSQRGKYKLLYESWLEFTRVCRSHGKIKSQILKPLMFFSLIEMKILYFLFCIKRFIKRG